MLTEIETPQDFPAGRTFQCGHCGATLRVGAPHLALRPYPHHTLEALIVTERIDEDRHIPGELDFTTPTNQLGIPVGELVLLEGTWREKTDG